MRLLVVTGTLLERDAVLHGLGSVSLARLSPYPDTRVAHPGVGTVVVLPSGAGAAAAAAATAVATNRLSPDLVLSMGLAGALGDEARPGTVVVADPIVAAEVAEGLGGPDSGPSASPFLGDETEADPVLAYEAPLPYLELTRGRLAGDLRLVVGPLLTVGAPSRDAEQARTRAARHPGALAEATGGYGAAVAAAVHSVPALEARVIGSRAGSDSSARTDAALDTLAELAQTLFARDWASTDA